MIKKVNSIFDLMYNLGEYEKEPLSKRRVGRVEPEENKGVGVSTIKCDDIEGYEYETAILDSNGAHPVERYKNKTDAIKGHNKWCKKSLIIKSVKEVGIEGLIDDQVIKIFPKTL